MTVAPSERPVTRLLRAYQTADPDAFVEALAEAVAGIGGRDVVLFLIDYAHVVLTPHPDPLPHGTEPVVVSLDGSMAGRAFTTSTLLASERDDGWRVWIPVNEQANRLGVIALTLTHWDDDVEYLCAELSLASAALLMATAQYTDLPHILRRRQHMGLAAEMQWSLLPPLSFTSSGVTISGLVEPAYEVGGDCFDYAYNDGRLDFAVLDTVGHGLNSAVLAGLLIGAYRHGRRTGDDLPGLAVRIDAAARTQPGQPLFATAILGRLEAATGQLTWLTCGHVPPLIARDGKTLPETTTSSGLPLGLGGLGSVVGDIAEVFLQPGDGVLVYTDGVVEARDPQGDFFGEGRLRDLFAREHAAGGPPQEAVRRLVRATVEHSYTQLRDDATMLYVRWDGPPGRA